MSFIGEHSGKPGKKQGADHTEEQYCKVWHASDGKMAGSTGKCGKGHDKNTGTDRSF